MKYNSTKRALIISICLGVSLTSLALNAVAADKEAPRWFEIEVILFKQLGDKKRLREKFTASTDLPYYNQSFNLLSDYIQPRISTLKRTLPLCHIPNHTLSFTETVAKNNTLKKPISIDYEKLFNPVFKEKSLTEIASLPTDFYSAKAEVYALATPENTNTFIREIASDSLLEKKITLRGLTSRQQLSLQGAEHAFAVMKLVQYDQFPSLDKNNFCRIPVSYFEKILPKEQLAQLNLDGFGVSHMPNKISASGLKHPSKPYLINERSLLLSDITQRLTWSKHFKPLLHFGWRQIGVTRKKSIPLQLFAGKHLTYQHQQLALQKSQEEPPYDNAKQTNQNMLFTINTAEKEQSKQSHEQRIKIQAMLAQLGTIEHKTIDQVINQLEQPIQTEKVDPSTSKAKQRLTLPAEPPSQPWELYGFLKVNLDHYLYISADLNLITTKLDDSRENDSRVQKQQQRHSQQTKSINFSQNRRVISGEVHYFDHPYIGMIVQIRRFDPNKPDDEAVTQAVKN